MDNNKPSVLKVRQGLQEFMTQSREISFGTEFSKEYFDLVNVDIELNNLDLAFNNYKIVNLTDIHIGQWLTPEYLDGVVDYVNTLKPDMITLTGDYVSYILEGYEEDLKNSFKKLKAKDSKLAVLGNHDHWLGAKEIRNILKKANVKDLSNDVYTLKKSGKKDNEEKLLNIGGVDSYTVGADDLNCVLNKLPQEGPAILLAHEPDFAKISSETKRFGLQISGHSHGGQFIIPGTNITPFRGPKSTKYPVGKYKVNNMIQYTSRGLGTNMFWMRINCKPEITQFNLKSREKQKIKIE
ncbi:metallophosphoesterase [uncultured Methanobrevibacter sp.]|uniref:metallophosphoesterase n=1 Tax=uncultured Methanobrevibacter sp. TaxID=253161 RepID=UPI00261F460B|nr:metallophosphoesterase [uncultured Methanobrevibacter sp.]